MLIGPAPVGFDERPDISQRVKRWPERSRCYKCRCCFGFIVVDKLYCGYKCAGREAPIPEPTPRGRPGAHVPRQCKLRGGKRFKRRYFTLGQAQEAARERNEPGLNAYYCDYCNYFHMGHELVDVAEQAKQEEARLKRAERREARREERRLMKERSKKLKHREQTSRQETRDFEESIEAILESRKRFRRRVIQQRKLRSRNHGKIQKP
jgi:hypothetical protein